MSQTQKHSVAEAWTNGVVGFLMSWGLLYVWLHYPLDPGNSFVMTASFTALTITRSYILRRLFDAYENRSARPRVRPSG